MRFTKKENAHLKERMQELLRQLDLYKSEVSKEFERRKGGGEGLVKEVELLKKDRERMSERQSELALALKEVSEDFKLQKDENSRLRDKINHYER